MNQSLGGRAALVLLTVLAGGASLALAQRGPGPDEIRAVQITTGFHQTCAVLTDGKVSCWGYNVVGQFLDDTAEEQLTPVSVPGIDDAISVGSGLDSTCVLEASGGVKCWGKNIYGSLGDGTTTTRTSPVSVLGITDAESISVNIRTACVLRRSGKVACWGGNVFGQVGDVSNELFGVDTPTNVVGVDDAVHVAVSDRHACAIVATGGVKCWGSNVLGELGPNAADALRNSAAVVPGVEKAVSLNLLPSGTCAVLIDGTVMCWGTFWHPVTRLEIKNSPPIVVSGLEGVSAMAWDCIVFAAGRLECGGEVVPGIDDVADISSSGHTCVLVESGRVMCWGSNYHGALGDGTRTPSDSPVRVVGF